MEKRQNFTPKFKAETVLEVLREQKNMTQIASERSLHPNQLTQWKMTALDGLAKLFERGEHDELEQLRAEHEKQTEQLYAEIGKLTTQLGWLENKSGRSVR